jgi:hypothetical protein
MTVLDIVAELESVERQHFARAGAEILGRGPGM